MNLLKYFILFMIFTLIGMFVLWFGNVVFGFGYTHLIYQSIRIGIIATVIFGFMIYFNHKQNKK